jgi:hypothetical protein
MRRFLLVAAALVALVAGLLGALPGAAAPKKRAADFTFDGFRLGDEYAAKVMSRAPYDQPCDDDPIDNKARRFMVYGALPCRDRTFPDQTTVMFYLRHSEEKPLQQPILAFAYLHGSYFDARTDFPLKPGVALDRARQVLGAAGASFPIARKRTTLTVHPFPGDIYVVAKEAKVVGFVLGPMPTDPKSEQWRGLMQMYDRYTPQN